MAKLGSTRVFGNLIVDANVKVRDLPLAYSGGFDGPFNMNDFITDTMIGSINANSNTPFGSAWYNTINIRHRGGEGDGSVWGGQIAFGMTSHRDRIAFRGHNSGTWEGWKELWHNGNFNPSSYVPLSGASLTGLLRGQTNTSGAIADGNDAGSGFEAYSTGNAAAFITFHKSGHYAVRFGLDTDNQLKVGGWSMGAASYNIWHSGNFNPASYLTTSGKAADSELLDGVDSGSFLRSDAEDLYNPARLDFGSTGNWDSVGYGSMTNLHFRDHDQFWIGAGNGTWFTGTANSKSQASGLAADATSAHDLLLTTMLSDANYDRGITFAVDNSVGNSGWRLGKWHSGTNASNSMLAVNGQIHAKGGHTDSTDYYADDYSTYYSTGQGAWVGDGGYGWHKPSVVAAKAIQIQSGTGSTNSAKPQLQFHQYGYGGPVFEYDGPNKTLQFYGPDTRFTRFRLNSHGVTDGLLINFDQVWSESRPLQLQYSSSQNTYINGNSGGSVGIGHTTASKKLDVNGGIRTRGGEYNEFNTWTDLTGHHGLYSSVYNGAHFYPNPGSYGPWLITGTRGGWGGIEFGNLANGAVTFMIGTSSNVSGVHNNSYGWQWRWESGTMYIHKGTYGAGTQAVALDSSNYTSYAPVVNATNTQQGGVKMRVDGATLYIRSDGTDA
jgi:hypothetical protein